MHVNGAVIWIGSALHGHRTASKQLFFDGKKGENAISTSHQQTKEMVNKRYYHSLAIPHKAPSINERGLDIISTFYLCQLVYLFINTNEISAAVLKINRELGQC